jgi:hypothetical protein
LTYGEETVRLSVHGGNQAGRISPDFEARLKAARQARKQGLQSNNTTLCVLVHYKITTHDIESDLSRQLSKSGVIKIDLNQELSLTYHQLLAMLKRGLRSTLFALNNASQEALEQEPLQTFVSLRLCNAGGAKVPDMPMQDDEEVDLALRLMLQRGNKDHIVMRVLLRQPERSQFGSSEIGGDEEEDDQTTKNDFAGKRALLRPWTGGWRLDGQPVDKAAKATYEKRAKEVQQEAQLEKTRNRERRWMKSTHWTKLPAWITHLNIRFLLTIDLRSHHLPQE